MELAIIGLPRSGKTTVFQALTGGRGETAGAARVSLGVVKAPDPRLDALAGIFKPPKVVPAEVTYLDLPSATPGFGRSRGIEGQVLNQLSRADALVHVVRAFSNAGISQETGDMDPAGQIATMEMELAFSDLAILERRLERIDVSLKGARPQERETAQKEKELLTRVKEGLERERPVREQSLAAEERPLLEGFQLLTAKPLLVALNIGEAQLSEAAELEAAVQKGSGCKAIALCGKLEAELAQLSEAEAQEFMAVMGIQESGRGRMIMLSYQTLGIITFFTAASSEVRAWSIQRDQTAPQAAGKVHTDMQRGFIRAEVVSYEAIVDAGSIAEARRRGVLRLEGKDYLVRDGDVINFRFNV